MHSVVSRINNMKYEIEELLDKLVEISDSIIKELPTLYGTHGKRKQREARLLDLVDVTSMIKRVGDMHKRNDW